MPDPTRNEGRPTVFACTCGRTFLAIPAVNPLNGPSFFDGDRVVARCPDCGTDLAWALRFGPAVRGESEHRGPDGSRRPGALRPGRGGQTAPKNPHNRPVGIAGDAGRSRIVEAEALEIVPEVE